MQATAGDVVITTTDDQVAEIEGNVYFPPAAVSTQHLRTSRTQYTCPWKGAAQYWDVTTDEGVLPDAP